MARYFFHTQTESRSTDPEGMEFDDHIEARRQAVATCGQMLKDAPEGFWGSRPWSVVVTDASGLILWEILMDGIAAPAILRSQAEAL